MNRTAIGALLAGAAAAGLALAGSARGAGCSVVEPSRDAQRPARPELRGGGPPPIDRQAPPRTETATFALG